MELVKKGAVWLIGALCALLVVLLMLFYRAEAIEAQGRVQELTKELVLAEEALDERIVNEAINNTLVGEGRVKKQTSQERTRASIEIIEREGSSTPLDVHSIEQLRLRSSQTRQAALDNASGADRAGSSASLPRR